MYEGELYRSSGSTITETQTSYGTTTSYKPSYDYSQETETPYKDDYSVTPNYEEQQSYESKIQTEIVSEEETNVRKINAPVIRREVPTVVLTKTVQKIQLSARMKLVASMFSIIMASLIFLLAWNFISAAQLNRTVDGRQSVVNQLIQDISKYEDTYNEISDDEYLEARVKDAGFVESNESNTAYGQLGELYEEPHVDNVHSNWFNDLCNFLSKLFS